MYVPFSRHKAKSDIICATLKGGSAHMPLPPLKETLNQFAHFPEHVDSCSKSVKKVQDTFGAIELWSATNNACGKENFRPQFISKMDKRMEKCKRRALRKFGCPLDESENLTGILHLISSLYKF